MSTLTHTVPKTQPAERATAALQIACPIGVSLLAPHLDPSAATYAWAAYGAAATFASANYMNRLGRWANQLPGQATHPQQTQVGHDLLLRQPEVAGHLRDPNVLPQGVGHEHEQTA